MGGEALIFKKGIFLLVIGAEAALDAPSSLGKPLHIVDPDVRPMLLQLLVLLYCDALLVDQVG